MCQGVFELRSGIILPFFHNFTVNSVRMTSGTAADQLEMAGSADSIRMSTAEFTMSILVNRTGHRVFSSSFTNCPDMAPVLTAQLPHQNRIPCSLLEVAGGLCYLLYYPRPCLGEYVMTGFRTVLMLKI